MFVHEFAGEAQSWNPQLNFFARRYRAIAFNARGYPPSDVPDDASAYSQAQAAADIVGVLDGLGIAKAHVCGLSMGGYAALHFGLSYPERALSITVAGAADQPPCTTQSSGDNSVRCLSVSSMGPGMVQGSPGVSTTGMPSRGASSRRRFASSGRGAATA